MEVNMYKKVSTDLNFVDREKQTEKFWGYAERMDIE